MVGHHEALQLVKVGRLREERGSVSISAKAQQCVIKPRQSVRNRQSFAQDSLVEIGSLDRRCRRRWECGGYSQAERELAKEATAAPSSSCSPGGREERCARRPEEVDGAPRHESGKGLGGESWKRPRGVLPPQRATLTTPVFGGDFARAQ